MTNLLYEEIAQLVLAMENCKKSKNADWLDKHNDRILKLVKNHMPSGAGFDGGTLFDFVKSTSEKLVFNTAFHHMDSNGYYSGWTEHVITVKPSLAFDFTMHISGQNVNDIKDYMHETFDTALRTEVE